jgi:malonyl-CoA/methylmalonyl-CoA synthetase
MLSHENLLTTIESLHTIWGHSDQDVLLHVLPIFHVHGLIFAFHGALHAGMKIIMRTKFEASDTLSCIEQYGCTVFMGVPTMYHRLLQAAESGQPQLKTMRLWVSGSAPLAATTFEQFKQIYGHSVLERYGMSETGINTSNPLNGERKPGSVGLPLPGVSLRLVSLDGAEVKPGEVGEVWVQGKNVFQGYWQMPAKTQESFKDGWFMTGDLGYQDADGYLFLIGRSKDLIISGGMNVYPKEIEAVIELSSAVEEAAVVGVPDADLGERVVAYVVAKAGQEVDLAEIAALCHTKLAGYKRPKAIYVIDQLPRNTMGKVTKNQLRDRSL